MAILGDFEVTVNIGGVPATEYDGDQHDGEGDQQSATSVTKYIEAVSGQFFGFVLTVKRGYVMPIGDTIAWRIKIDGKFVTGINFQRDLLARNGGFVDHLDGIDRRINGQNILQKFKFSDLSLRDMDESDNKAEFKQKYGDLGTLCVEVWHADYVRDGEHTDREETQKIGVDNVPEKAVKGRPLHVATSFVNTPASRVRQIGHATRLGDSPAAVFNFEYLTKRALQSLMIIERTPTPIPLEDRPVEDLTREEMAELLRRQRQQILLQEEQKAIKRERSSIVVEGSPLKMIKGSKGQKVYVYDSDDEDGIEVIDSPTGKGVGVVDLR